MVDGDPGHVVSAHLEAFSAGELDRMLSTLSCSAHFVTGRTTVDPPDFREFFGWAIREISPKIKIETLLVDGDEVACQFVESITVDGSQQHLSRAAFYRVEGGVITSAKVYDERD
ncbi:MAG: nuclear transport factor 2 family protein [Actinomycetota bacterium]|nr:nuclear transport factor 2 family protein [Actinomycetota bacterium]